MFSIAYWKQSFFLLFLYQDVFLSADKISLKLFSKNSLVNQGDFYKKHSLVSENFRVYIVKDKNASNSEARRHFFHKNKNQIKIIMIFWPEKNRENQSALNCQFNWTYLRIY